MYRRILLGCDPDGLARAAVPAVAALARDFHAEVLVVAAEEMTGRPACRAVTEAWLDRVAGELSYRHVAARRELRRARRGAVANELVAAARGWGADLIALGTHRRGDLEGLLVGSVGHQVATRIDTPVLFVGGPRAGDAPDRAAPRRRVLVAVDDSEPAEAAVRAAADLATAETAIRMVHALGVGTLGAPPADPPAAEAVGRELLGRAESILEAAGRSAECELLPGAGPVGERLARAADAFDADLIVLGSRRLTDFGGLLLGSVAHDVIHRTNRPVFLAEHPHDRVGEPAETREGTTTSG